MLNQSSNAFSLQINESNNIVSLDKARIKKYNPQAAFYALPKAFINRLLFQISGSTLKVFLALVNHTDCWNVIKYPDRITHSGIMKTTGVKKKDTISKAYRELCALGIIGGYVPGHGSENTRFYFTFDIDHYKTEECCLELDEISSYYEMLLTGKFSNLAPESVPDPDEASPAMEDQESICEDYNPDRTASLSSCPDLPIQDKIPLNYITTIINSRGTNLKLFYGKDPTIYLLEDGSIFCTRKEFLRDYQQYIVSNSPLNHDGLELVKLTDKIKDIESDNYQCSPEAYDLNTADKKTLFQTAKNGTPSPHKMVQGCTEKKDSLNTINSYKINSLIVNARKDFKFIHEFNDFCVDDSPKYLKNTLFWITKNAADYDLSLGEVIESLSAANAKSKNGSMCYLLGIMRNKSGNKSRGVKVITKPLFVQVKQYFGERFSHSLDYLKSYAFDWDSKELRYTPKDQSDGDTLKEFFKFVVEDINKAVGVSLSAVEIA